MRSTSILVFLTLVVLFGPWAVDFNLRIAIVAVLASISFYIYMRHKISQWRRGGLNPATVLIGRILGAVLGACAAMIGGALARLSVASTLEAEALDLAPIEMLAGALFGMLLGASEGISTDLKSNVLIGAVSGGFGGASGGAMGEIQFGTTSGRIILGALGGGAAGAFVGALLGYSWRFVHQAVLNAFPGLKK